MTDAKNNSHRWLKPYLIVFLILFGTSTGLDVFRTVRCGMARRANKTHVYNRVGKLMRNQQYDKLLALCDSELQSDPVNRDALWGKARAHYQREEWQESIAAFQDAIVVCPSWAGKAKPFIEICKTKSEETEKETGEQPLPHVQQ